MPIREVISSQRVPIKIWVDEVDDKSRAQLRNIASLPFIHHHVAAMSDVHLGIGATIGSMIATHKAIIPAAVGVDLGCGMVAARLSIPANELDEKALNFLKDRNILPTIWKRCTGHRNMRCKTAPRFWNWCWQLCSATCHS